MAKELTVVLKTPQPPAKSAGSKLLDALNGIVKSPVFVFVFGASFSAFLPALQNLAISDQELAARKAAEEARTDAVLVAPFIANLDASQPGKFEAAKAALRALAEAAGAADPTRERVMFTAVTRAIDATAVQIKPPTDKQLLTAEVVRQIDSQAQKAPAPPPSVPLNFDALKDAVVYVQVDQGKPEQAEAASEVVKSLKTNDVSGSLESTLVTRPSGVVVREIKGGVWYAKLVVPPSAAVTERRVPSTLYSLCAPRNWRPGGPTNTSTI